VTSEERPDPITLGAFALLIVLAGGNAVAIRIAGEELDAFWGATLRFTIAGLIFAVLMVGLHVPLPRGRTLVGAAIYGVLAFGLAFGIAFIAIRMTGAGLAQVLLGTVPLMTLVLVPLHGLERFRPRAMVGSVVALAGIAILAADRIALDIPIEGIGLALVVALLLAEAGIVAKVTPGADPIATNAVGTAAGVGLLVPLSLIVGERWTLPSQQDTWLAIGYLGVIGSVAVFWLFIVVLRRWTASAASFQFLLIPLATVPFSAWLTGEVVTPLMVLGGAVVLLGVYIGVFHRGRARTAVAEAQQPLG
jgi:drug/metabolite transporter (DMT)-like permease